jgi:cyclophilin family peptidyl-prolyl cis-trans isomerase
MRIALTSIAALLAFAFPLAAQEGPKGAPSPGEIVAAAPAKDWVAIAPSDLLVMTLAPDRDGNKRQVVIQLMPPPISQGWVGNIRKLAAARWWDGLAITRVQDNYVVQWGDPHAEDKARAKPLPHGLAKVPAEAYVLRQFSPEQVAAGIQAPWLASQDAYAPVTFFRDGWPMGSDWERIWPVHCYGAVGVGRDNPPDTGSGAELYTVIGHGPRHLDRNIAVVGRVVEGIQHLSTLPRGTGALGFYDKAEERVPVVSIRLATELPEQERPRFEYLDTGPGVFEALRPGEAEKFLPPPDTGFARYADARANRRDPFFIVPAGGADICNIPVPVRRVAK